MKRQARVYYVDDAERLGNIPQAVILQCIRWWIEKNAANRVNIRQDKDGKEYVWTYNSRKAWAELLPEMSADTVGRHLRTLEKLGEIRSGCFNDNNYDRTKWYTTPEYAFPDCVQSHSTLCEPAQSIVQDCTTYTSRVPVDIPVTNKPPVVPQGTATVKRFVKPTPEQVTEYARSRKASINGERFFDFYEQKGWMIGKNHMKDWQASVRLWISRNEKESKSTVAATDMEKYYAQ